MPRSFYIILSWLSLAGAARIDDDAAPGETVKKAAEVVEAAAKEGGATTEAADADSISKELDAAVNQDEVDKEFEKCEEDGSCAKKVKTPEELNEAAAESRHRMKAMAPKRDESKLINEQYAKMSAKLTAQQLTTAGAASADLEAEALARNNAEAIQIPELKDFIHPRPIPSHEMEAHGMDAAAAIAAADGGALSDQPDDSTAHGSLSKRVMDKIPWGTYQLKMRELNTKKYADVVIDYARPMYEQHEKDKAAAKKAALAAAIAGKNATDECPSAAAKMKAAEEKADMHWKARMKAAEMATEWGVDCPRAQPQGMPCQLTR